MLKVRQSEREITPFGGIHFCHDLLDDAKLPSTINRHLGSRGEQAKYSYSDVIGSHLSVFLCGGDATEDINDHLREDLQQIQGLKVPSADTILRSIKQLATPTKQVTSESGVQHAFNINLSLNRLMLKTLRATRQLCPEDRYTLDYDNHIVQTEKADARRTYKKTKGYQPGVATIGSNVVYLEGRGGNSPAKYKQHKTLQRTFKLLHEQAISVARFRADSASYQQAVVEQASAHCTHFYIRAVRSGAMGERVRNLTDDEWKRVSISGKTMEVATINEWRPFDGKTSYRLVVSRIDRDSDQEELFEEDQYTWRAILTDDLDWSAEKIIGFYNQRGGAERNFDVLGNDFGWKRLPCSQLNENTAFMILTAIYQNLYQFLIRKLSGKLDWLKPAFRLKKFIFRFISVPAKWIRSGRQKILKLYASKDYSPLLE